MEIDVDQASAPASPTGPNGPLVSVIMSVYNSETYLREAVESILAQRFTDFEFLIVDDGSTDHSLAILKPYAEQDARVRIVSRPNTGLIGALNELIGLARGRYLARMDADDIAMPNRFARQVAYLNEHPECACLGSRVMLMDPYGSPVAITGHELTHEKIDHELMTRSGWAMVHPSVMMRRDAVVRAGRYREQWKHCEDHDLFLRLAEVGKVANLAEPLLWYRRHYLSINFTKREDQAKLKLALLNDAYSRRGLKLPDGFEPVRWTPEPKDQQSRLWGWAAIKHGHLAVAKKHAWAALKQSPTKLASWKLWAVAMKKSLMNPTTDPAETRRAAAASASAS